MFSAHLNAFWLNRSGGGLRIGFDNKSPCDAVDDVPWTSLWEALRKEILFCSGLVSNVFIKGVSKSKDDFSFLDHHSDNRLYLWLVHMWAWYPDLANEKSWGLLGVSRLLLYVCLYVCIYICMPPSPLYMAMICGILQTSWDVETAQVTLMHLGLTLDSHSSWWFVM